VSLASAGIVIRVAVDGQAPFKNDSNRRENGLRGVKPRHVGRARHAEQARVRQMGGPLAAGAVGHVSILPAVNHQHRRRKAREAFPGRCFVPNDRGEEPHDVPLVVHRPFVRQGAEVRHPARKAGIADELHTIHFVVHLAIPSRISCGQARSACRCKHSHA